MNKQQNMSDILKNSIKNKESTNEEILSSNIECLCCSEKIIGKPWITVFVPTSNSNVHACGYSCSNKLHQHIGHGYWKNVVNKEDFNEPRPVFKCDLYSNKDITANFGIDEIREEIKKEEELSQMIENEYYSESEESFGYPDDY